MAPHPDRRAARRRHAGRLQDRRLRARQAPRMGLEGRHFRDGSPAQLSVGQSDTQPGATDLPGPQPGRSPRSDRQGLRQYQSLRRLQRVRSLGHCLWTGGLRQLRPTGGLRCAREDGDRRQGQGRPGALWRTLPRTEGLECPEARCEGDPDLLRSGRRRIRQGRCLSPRTIPPGVRHPARQRPVPFARTGRSIDSLRPFHQGGEAAAVERETIGSEGSRNPANS